MPGTPRRPLTQPGLDQDDVLDEPAQQWPCVEHADQSGRLDRDATSSHREIPQRANAIRLRLARPATSASGSESARSQRTLAAYGVGKAPAPPTVRTKGAVRSATSLRASSTPSTRWAGTAAAKARVTWNWSGGVQWTPPEPQRGSRKASSSADMSAQRRTATNIRWLMSVTVGVAGLAWGEDIGTRRCRGQEETRWASRRTF